MTRSLSTSFSNLLKDFDRGWDGWNIITEGPSVGSYPKVDISETDKELVLEASVAGLTRDNLSVEYSNNSLRIYGQKQEKRGNYIRKELHKSSFSRVFSVPASHYDVDKIEAKLENGLLIIKIPKFEGKVAKSNKINIA